MARAGDRISEYILTEKCGEGGFGEVWKAHHHIFAADTVAVKIPTDRTYVDFLRNEGVIQHNLQHPHIVRTLGLDPAASPPYFVMEFVEGKSLRSLLKEKRRLGFREAADVAIQILEALGHAHEKGVTHRDLKPENILVSAAGPCSCERHAVHQSLGGTWRVKITDFGLGHVTRHVAQTMYLSGAMKTEAGAVITGTLDYMAPEQRRGRAEPDSRSDLYSWAIVFYEMLMGDVPVGAFRYPGQTRDDVPPEIDLVLRACLQPEPGERLAGAREALDDLLAAVEGRPLSHVARLLPIERGVEAVPLAQLAPLGVFTFRGGQEAATLQDLVSTADANWEDGKHHLYSGDVESWLRRVGEKELSRRAMEIREGYPDRNVGLEAFLQATGRVARPRLELDVARLDFDDVPRGLSRRTRIFVNNPGRGWLSGTASSTAPWLRVLTPVFAGDDVPIEILVDSDGLRPAETHEGALLIRSNGGDASVPVRIAVVPQPARLRVEEKVLYVAASGSSAEGHLTVANEGDDPLVVVAEAPGGCLRFHETFPLQVAKRYRVGFSVDVDRMRESGAFVGDRGVVPVTVSGNGGVSVVPVRVQRSGGSMFWQVALGSVAALLLYAVGSGSPVVFHVAYVFGIFRLLYKLGQPSSGVGTEASVVDRASSRSRAVTFWGAFCVVGTLLLLGGNLPDDDVRVPRTRGVFSRW
jgi:tRNA A-37 threonylcarbamoyl transferase component Bud32